jgi:hypothetical protein
VAIVQISRITQRKGLAQDLPQPLAGAELGWVTDERRLYIGNGTLQEGAPVVGNTEVLTEFSDILNYATEYTYKGEDFGLLPPVQTGTIASAPVSQSLQSRLDSTAIITDFGATGDGTIASGSGTDVTANINNALNQLYCQDAAMPQTRRGLYFPAGVYIISDTLNIPPYCYLYGDGPESTIIYFYVATWTNTVTYASGVLVEHSGSYYRSAGAVPVGVSITNTTYWTATTLPSYIVRTADSLQQTGDNIGTNGALLPGSFEISRMKFVTNQVMNGVYVEAAQDCSFESINIAGPETTSTLNAATNDTACIRWNSTDAAICGNVEWNHCSFSGMVYGSNTNEQIQGATISNCSFDTLYQGVYLGSDPAPTVGPTGFRIVGNNFNNIYAEGIVMINVGLNCSAYNAFYEVGNHFNGTTNPATPVIDMNGTNNVSLGDMFQRTNPYATGLSHPRIKLNDLNGIALGMDVSNITFWQNGSNPTINANPSNPFNRANQLAMGVYQRTSGITDTLADNVGSARTLFTFDAVYIKAVRIDYTIVRDTAVRTGTYTIVAGTDASGTNLQGSDSGVQNSAPGQTFAVSETGSVVSWTYTTTSTGTAGTIYYSVTKLA